MQSGNDVQGLSEARVYHLTEETLSNARIGLYVGLFMIWGFMPFMTFLVAWGADRRLERVEVVMFLILFAVGAVVLASSRSWHRVSLQVAPEGVIYQSPNITIHSSWDNVTRIQDRWGIAKLILYRPSATSIPKRLRYLRYTSYALWKEEREVPLTPFGWSTKSALYQDVQTLAPHLFVDRRPKSL